MKKLFKKMLSVVTAAAMIFTIFASPAGEILGFAGDSVKAAAVSYTADEAIAWAKSQVGKSIDYDGAYGAQCVDLIKAYYKYLGVSPVTGNGCDYATNSLPSGWTRTKGATPQKGDVLVFTGGSGGYGHVAIYESDYSTYHQNYHGQYVENITSYYATPGSSLTYWGVIRPNFSSVSPAPAYSTIASATYFIKNTSTNTYLSVDSGTDANKQNVSVASKSNTNAFKWKFTNPSGKAYKIRPLCSTSRLLNPYGSTVASGNNVNLYDDTDSTQWWCFEAVDGGYVIRNYANSACVLDISGTNVLVSTYVAGKQSQIWTLAPVDLVQPTISFDKSSYEVGDTVNITWAATPSSTNFSHYWLTVRSPAGDNLVHKSMGSVNSYALTVTEEGTYTIIASTTPVGSPNGENSLIETKKFEVGHKHSYTSKVTLAATCRTPGSMLYTCSVCGDSYTETIAKTPHTYSSSYTVDKAATCSAEGSKSRHCTTLGCTAKTDVTAIPMTSHDYASTVVAPTYNEQGYTLHKCVNCGDIYKDTYTDIKKLPAVKGFTSPSRSTSAIRLNWTKNANADGYVIEQYTSDGWVQIADITDSATVTYKVTGLKSGTAYKFRMKAYVNGTDGAVYGTKTATLTVNTLASSVSGLALKSRSASALRLKWTKNTAVDGYIIEQKIDGKWVQIADIDDYKTTEYKVTGLAASAKYSFRMKAYAITKYGDKTYSGYTSTLSKTTSPANVTGLKIGGRAGTALRLNWNKNTSADGYIIEQYKGGKWTQIAEITDNATTTYRIDGLSPATQYKFRVKAYNMVGTTALYSNYTATLAAYTNPSAVSGLKIAGRAYSALRLSWTQNTTADGYIIEQYIDGKWTRIARIAGNETVTFRVDGLTSGTTYKFRVATYNIEDSVAYYGAYVTISGTTL